MGGSPATTINQAAPAPASPPVSTSSAEVTQAEQDLRRQNSKKKGFGRATILAGDTGGYMPTNPNPSPTNPGIKPGGAMQKPTLGG